MDSQCGKKSTADGWHGLTPNEKLSGGACAVQWRPQAVTYLSALLGAGDGNEQCFCFDVW